jgi:hypothetical protein
LWGQKQQKAGTIIKEMRAFAEEELDNIALKRIVIQDAVDLAKVEASKTRTLFSEEKGRKRIARAQNNPYMLRSIAS